MLSQNRVHCFPARFDNTSNKVQCIRHKTSSIQSANPSNWAEFVFWNVWRHSIMTHTLVARRKIELTYSTTRNKKCPQIFVVFLVLYLKSQHLLPANYICFKRFTVIYCSQITWNYLCLCRFYFGRTFFSYAFVHNFPVNLRSDKCATIIKKK